MKKSTLNRAKEAAHKFIDAANRTKTMAGPDRFLDAVDTGKEAAALRRASMELTRALADLRQNR